MSQQKVTKNFLNIKSCFHLSFSTSNLKNYYFFSYELTSLNWTVFNKFSITDYIAEINL